jgi:hypothetical protein
MVMSELTVPMKDYLREKERADLLEKALRAHHERALEGLQGNDPDPDDELYKLVMRALPAVPSRGSLNVRKDASNN